MNPKITNNRNLISLLLGLILLILVFEILRDARRAGDFIGYINAGNATLNGVNIYDDPLNTWPPFFSIFSVPLAIVDGWSPYLVRILWLLGMLVAFYGVLKLSAAIFLKRKFTLLSGDLTMYDAVILVPFLILFRYLLDNLSYLQINIHMLWMSLLTIYLFVKGKYKWAAFWLALSISLKVYTIFLLLFFMYKRAFKITLWTFIFLMIMNAIPMLVYGIDGALEYYQYWLNEIASPPPTAHHKNQSVMGALLRMFTSENTGMEATMNFMSASADSIKRFTYLLIGIIAIIPAYLFRSSIGRRNSNKRLIEFAFILTAIPILSPLSWKAYFIFLWVPTLLIYGILWHSHNGLSRRTSNLLKGLFIASAILTIFSTEGIIGHYWSDIVELYSCITFGTILLLIILLTLHVKSKFKLRA